MFAYTRTDGNNTVLAVFNFSDREATISIDTAKKYRVLLHTNWEEYGGATPKALTPLPDIVPPFTGILCI